MVHPVWTHPQQQAQGLGRQPLGVSPRVAFGQQVDDGGAAESAARRHGFHDGQELERLEPIRWPRAEKAGELARSIKRPAPTRAAGDDDGEGDA